EPGIQFCFLVSLTLNNLQVLRHPVIGVFRTRNVHSSMAVSAEVQLISMCRLKLSLIFPVLVYLFRWLSPSMSSLSS
ncbi:hypothetical protein S83_060411, partial [Arachis hypogaea]